MSVPPPAALSGEPLPPTRKPSCGHRVTYAFCRTWFFEVLFTFFPCLLIALIIAGVYEFEETTRTFTTQQLYEHSMSPVTVALQAFLDRKLGTLDHVAAFVEGGGWPDVADFDPISAQVVPFFSRDEALRDGHAGVVVADEVEVGYVNPDANRLVFATYGNPAAEHYVSQRIFLADGNAAHRVRRERFVDYASFAPGLGLFSPNISYQSTNTEPWIPNGYAAESTALFSFDTVGGAAGTFGMRFETLHPRSIVGTSLQETTPSSQWFMTIDRETTFAAVMPPCDSRVHAVIWDPGTFEIVFWNCGSETGNPRRITDVGLLNDAFNTRTPPQHVRISDIQGFQRVSASGIAAVESMHLGTIWFVENKTTGAVREGEAGWPSHDRLSKSISQRVNGLTAVADSVRNFVAARVITAETVTESENFMASVLGVNTFVDAAYQLLPYRGGVRPMAVYAVLFNGTKESGGHAVFRHDRYEPTEAKRTITTRYFASDRLDCSADALRGKTIQERQPCAARALIENGTTPFLAGFGERILEYAFEGDLTLNVPLWARRTINYTLEHANASQRIFTHPEDRDRGLLTIMRAANLPRPAASMPWSPAVKPDNALVSYSYSINELRATMIVLLGQYAGEGSMRIIDRDMSIIAEAGASAANNADDREMLQTVTARVFQDFVEGHLNRPCDRSSRNFVCDVATRTPLAFFYKINHNAVRSSYVAFAKLVSHANTGTWYTMQRLPGELTTTVTTTEKLVSGTAVFIAVLFLIVNAGYVAWATISVTDLKRYMRALARNKAPDNLPLSSNTEIREIELALRKTKRAIAEYSRFLPTGLDRGQDLPAVGEAAQVVLNARLGKSGSEVFAVSPAPATGEAAPAANAYRQNGNGAGDADDDEMDERPAAAGDAPLPADSVAETDGPATQPRTYDDILLTHQVGVARRDMAVLSLQLADVSRLARSSGANVLSAVLARVAPVFHDAVRRGGGMVLPMGTGVGTFCAVWSASRTRNVHHLAAVAAVTIANTLAARAAPQLVGRQPFSQASVAVAFGSVDVGTVGDKDSRRTMLFVGECMDRVTALHRAAGDKLRRVGCNRKDEKTVDGCPVACVCDAAFADEVPDNKAHVLPGGSDGLWHLVALRRIPKPGMQAAEPPTPEARLAEALRPVPGAPTVRPDKTALLSLVAECTAPMISVSSKPIAVIDHLV